MFDANAFGLEGFEVVESSEQGMLAQVARANKKDEPIVFLGWEPPHPMNANFEMSYLTGGDDYFGPNLGGAVVDTNTRAGYVADCPNVGKLLTNLEFSLAMENEIMGAILNDGEDPSDAAKAWLAANPDAFMGSGRRDHDGRWRQRRRSQIRPGHVSPTPERPSLPPRSRGGRCPPAGGAEGGAEASCRSSAPTA